MNKNNEIDENNKLKPINERIALYQSKNQNTNNPLDNKKKAEIIKANENKNQQINISNPIKDNKETKNRTQNNDDNSLNLNKEKSNKNIQDKKNIFEPKRNEENKNLNIKKEKSTKEILKNPFKEKFQEINEDIRASKIFQRKQKLNLDKIEENENNSNKPNYDKRISLRLDNTSKTIANKKSLFEKEKKENKASKGEINEENKSIINKEANVNIPKNEKEQKSNNIQQKIKEMEKNQNERNNEVKKPREKRQCIEPSVFENLKLLYQKSSKEQNNIAVNKEKNLTNINKNNENINQNNNTKAIEENKNDEIAPKEKELSTEKLALIKMEKHISDIRNKKKDDTISSKTIPKKLNLNEIFKKMNIEQIASNINEGKREELIKLAQKKKEQEENLISINEVVLENEQENPNDNIQEMDNEDDVIQEKEEDENIVKENENNINNNNIQEGESELKNDEEEIVQEKEDKKDEKVPNKKEKFLNNLHNIKNKLKESFNKIRKISVFNSEKEEQTNICQIPNLEQEEELNIRKNLFNNENDETICIGRISNDEQRNNTTFGNDIYLNDKTTLTKHESHFNFFERKTEKKSFHNSLQTSKSSKQFLTEKKNQKAKVEDILLEMKNISENSEEANNDKFCESFFLASFPVENGKILENSEDENADCNHECCNMLPAMQPEIIYKYPKKADKGLEINNLAASICFPNGIKICYEEDEEKIKTVGNYRSSFTNQVGDKFFAVTYHFFLKMLNDDFFHNYIINPMKYQLTTYQDELTSIFNDELEEDVIEKLKKYSELNFRENVYIPFCLCLISKYPFFEQMEKCLESIMISINNYETTPEELNQLITYIIESIPAPPMKSKISFALPHLNRLCEIKNPYFEDILQYGNNPIILLKYLSINNIISIFKLLIFEQKILVIGKDNDKISQIILNFVSLLYPFDWIHTCIPIMSEKMLKFLQAFLPFFNGMNYSLYKKAKPILTKAAKGVFIIDVDEDIIDINNNFKKNSKYIKGINYINQHFYNFPKNIGNLLYKELKSIKIDFDKMQNHNYDNSNINIRIKNLFLHTFVVLLYDYKKFSHIIDNYPVFNSFLLIEEKPNADKKFYKELTSTQLFQIFIQNSFCNDENKKFYFNERVNDYIQLKKTKDYNSNLMYAMIFEKFQREYLSNLTINKNYIIKPIFHKNFDEFQKNIEKRNKSLKLTDIVSFIYRKYDSYTNYLNNQGVLKENKRVVGRHFDLISDNDPKNYDIFILPKEKDNDLISIESSSASQKKDNEINSETSINNSVNKKRSSNKLKIISGDEKNSQNIRYSFYIRKRGADLSEEQIDEIKDNIRETMTRVYRSEIKDLKEDEKIIMDSIKEEFGRDYFINVITSGNSKERVEKVLQKDSFDFFRYIIFNTLLNLLQQEENDEIIICAMRLTKICIYIKMIENKKEVLLSDILFYVLEDYSLYKKKKFWTIWIEDDMTDSDIEIFRLLKLSKKKDINIDEENEKCKLYTKHSYDILSGLCTIMIKMKLSNSFIYSTITELIQEYVFDDKIFNKLMKEMIDELQFYQKLSNK